MTQTKTASRDWRPNAVWLAVAAFILIVSLGSNLLEIRYAYFQPETAGSWGMTFVADGADATVQSVEPGSRAAALGIRAGDRLRADNRFVFRKIPVTGETLRFTRISPGPAKTMNLSVVQAYPAPMAVPNPVDRLLDDCVRILMCLGGLIILLRGWGRRSTFLLGLGLVSLSPFPAVWLPSGPLAFGVWQAAGDSIFFIGESVLLPWFAMAFLTESGIRIPSWAKLVFWVEVTIGVVSYALVDIFPPRLFPGWTYDLNTWLAMPSGLAPFVLPIAILGVAWSRGTAEGRHRVILLMLALGLIFLSNSLFVVFDTLTRVNPRGVTDTSSAGRILGSSLFAYAVLRHRVIDVGFTLNRTLVYGGVSAILLAAFGLAEWGLHQLLALEGWEGSALLSAGLAVVIFLGFHPVRRFVEHYVSTIFFRPWRTKEQSLRKFVKEGGFFTDSARLATAFAGALEQFGGAPCCVYRRTDEGSFACAGGKMALVHADDATAVALRAEAGVCEIDASGSSVEGVLAFPMIHCHDLEGFAVLGAKPDGERYRPDEIELVDWATRQVGQDLYALAVEQLRTQREERDREIAVLTGRNADLQLALASRPSAARRAALRPA